MTTPTKRLSSLTAIIDANNLKAQGRTFEAKNLEPLAQKWKSFNWNVISVDGHDVAQLCGALDDATKPNDQPTVIIAKTTKGKGISFMEDQLQFHNSPITKEQWKQAMNDVGNKVEES
jgi:transketolase